MKAEEDPGESACQTAGDSPPTRIRKKKKNFTQKQQFFWIYFMWIQMSVEIKVNNALVVLKHWDEWKHRFGNSWHCIVTEPDPVEGNNPARVEEWNGNITTSLRVDFHHFKVWRLNSIRNHLPMRERGILGCTVLGFGSSKGPRTRLKHPEQLSGVYTLTCTGICFTVSGYWESPEPVKSLSSVQSLNCFENQKSASSGIELNWCAVRSHWLSKAKIISGYTDTKWWTNN